MNAFRRLLRFRPMSLVKLTPIFSRLIVRVPIAILKTRRSSFHRPRGSGNGDIAGRWSRPFDPHGRSPWRRAVRTASMVEFFFGHFISFPVFLRFQKQKLRTNFRAVVSILFRNGGPR